ncbi:MAG: S9 family peptidase [Candidatus Ratteibacteria bacterium]|jgi:dipeptidyl aminopeptidase/acylaminoacyl peptidase
MKKSGENHQLIPRRVLFGNPEKTSPRISPNGRYFSFLAPVNGVLNVWVGEKELTNAVPITNDTDRGIRNYLWGYDSTILFYLQDTGGNENWRLYGVDLENGSFKDFTPFEEVQVHIIGYSRLHPDQMLLGINRDNPSLHDVYLLTISSGTLQLIEKNPGNATAWLENRDLQIKGYTASTETGGTELFLRTADNQWKKSISWDLEDAATSAPLSFPARENILHLIDSRDYNTGRLIELNTLTMQQRVLAEDPNADVSQIFSHPDTYEIQAVGFLKERLEWQILDPAIQEDFHLLGASEKADFTIVSRDASDTIWIIGYISDTSPTTFYSYNRTTKKRTFLFHTQPAFNEYSLAPMKPFSLKTKDHLTLHGYLTLPQNKHTNLPTVLYVHGGPWARDEWGFNPSAQWFANRGYACIQINYRGSTGYGKAFVNAGNREWGARMHDDLVDTVQWAIEEKIADPAKIAIFGGSYGGYAALVGATFTPDLFCCAVDIVGPSNLITLIRSVPPYWKPMISLFYTRVGNPDTEEEFLKSRSPLFKVDAIKIPLLIAQGANDPRVKQAESEQIVAELKKRNIPHEYMLFPDEGHGFVKPENRLAFYAAAERFLAQHLKGEYEEEEAQLSHPA